MSGKIAFYMSGSYARVLRHVPQFMPQFRFVSFCQNIKAYDSCKNSGDFDRVYYLYDKFNDKFGSIEVGGALDLFREINLAEVLYVDKAHYKRKSGEYQLKVILTMAIIFQEWIESEKPNYIFFPIIESVDAMLAYRIAQINGVKPICYAHARHMKCSFFSDSHTEILPSYFQKLPSPDGLKEKSEHFIIDFRKRPTTLSYKRTDTTVGDILPDEKPPNPIRRLFQNILLTFTGERHNQTLCLLIKFQVFFESFFIPLQKIIYLIIEMSYIKTTKMIPKEYDYFPLHFAPESSINTPAPFYIDQKRVVDKILLERKGSRPLVLKEHPAMFGKRPLRFFRDLKRTPFVTFVPVSTSSIDLTKSAKSVYSVTGTACLEAFLLGVPWIQFGDNFLNDWMRKMESTQRCANPEHFVEDVLKVSGDFLLYSPSKSKQRNMYLFSRTNVSNLARHLGWHIEQTTNYEQNR